MSNKHPYQSFDEQLREQFDQFLPEMPEGVWEGMESDLDTMNTDLQFDQGIREGVEQMQITPPQGVFEAIQSQLPGASGLGSGIGLVGKWVAGTILAGGIITVTWLGLSNTDKSVGNSEQAQSIQSNDKAGQEETNATGDIFSTENTNTGSVENNTANEVANPVNPASANGSTRPYSGSSGNGSKIQAPVNNGEERISNVPGVFAAPSKPLIPAVEDPAPVFCFSAMDTNLCMNQPYAFFLKNADNCSYDLWIDNMPYVRNVSGDKVTIVHMDRNGTRNIEVNVRKGERAWNKMQTLHVAELPVVNVIRVDQGNGKYAFESGCVNHTVSWYVDGVYYSKGSATQCQFYDPIPKDHQMLAIAKSTKGCSDSFTLEFRNNVTFVTKPLVAPNSFSPNGDGVNDNYSVEIEGASYFHMRIYNLNNELVFESKDPKAVWDGRDKFRGNTIHEGKYRLTVEYALAGGQKKEKVDWITLFTGEN